MAGAQHIFSYDPIVAVLKNATPDRKFRAVEKTKVFLGAVPALRPVWRRPYKSLTICFHKNKRGRPFSRVITTGKALRTKRQIETSDEPSAAPLEVYALLEFRALRHVPRSLLHGTYLLQATGSRHRVRWARYAYSEIGA